MKRDDIIKLGPGAEIAVGGRASAQLGSYAITKYILESLRPMRQYVKWGYGTSIIQPIDEPFHGSAKSRPDGFMARRQLPDREPEEPEFINSRRIIGTWQAHLDARADNEAQAQERKARQAQADTEYRTFHDRANAILDRAGLHANIGRANGMALSPDGYKITFYGDNAAQLIAYLNDKDTTT